MVARQAPLSMGLSRQEHWSGLSCPPQRDLPDPGVEPKSLVSPAPAGGFLTSPTWEPLEATAYDNSLHQQTNSVTQDMCVSAVKDSACHAADGVRMIPWRRAWQTTPIFLPGKSHGQRSLAGYHP